MFLDLLFDLCSGVSEPARAKTGRPRIPIQDALFAACFKIYSTVSCRRFMCDLREAHTKGYLSKLPHFNSIFNYLENRGADADPTVADQRNEPAAESD